MSGWEVRFSSSHKVPYFYNQSTGQSVWEPPAELSADQISALPGAEHLAGAAGSRGGGGKPDGQVRASHILAKHKGSRRPSSWREANITRSLAEAHAIIQADIERLRALPPAEAEAEFARIAAERSDCSSARKGGDLGWFGRGQMQKPFEEATFALQPGQLSDIVETDSGVHVILRTG
ncbi:peptidyl-prolyl cis-trans isomerase Pin1 [Cryptotrichosporon argae]